MALGTDTVYVLTSGTACALPRAPRGAVALLLHSMSLMVARRLALDIELLRDKVEPVVLPPPCPLDVAPHDFGTADELIARSLDLTRRYLDQTELAGIAPMPPHSTRLSQIA